MKRPPFQMRPARRATLTCNGKFVVGGRASFVWETFLLRRVAGVPGDYAIRGESKVWHRLDWTISEAEEMLSAFGGRFATKRVKQMREMRASRKRRGLEVG